MLTQVAAYSVHLALCVIYLVYTSVLQFLSAP